MVHDFWLYRKDPEFVRAQLPTVRSTLDWFLSRQNPNGLLGKLHGGHLSIGQMDFQRCPSPTATGDSAILSLQLVEALRYAAEMEASIGNQALAPQDAEEATRISRALRELCWEQGSRIDRRHSGAESFQSARERSR
jgi:alpha-L-rhamnosidase